jgi:hypothetical protein
VDKRSIVTQFLLNVGLEQGLIFQNKGEQRMGGGEEVKVETGKGNRKKNRVEWGTG